jgi:hypothetical protein
MVDERYFHHEVSMSSRSSTDHENTGSPLPRVHSVDSSCRRRPASRGGRGGWIPAFAGMTEQRVVIDRQIIAARVFSKEARRTRRVGITNIPNFATFVSFAVSNSPICCAAMPR